MKKTPYPTPRKPNQLASHTRCRAIAGRTAWCCCKFR